MSRAVTEDEKAAARARAMAWRRANPERDAESRRQWREGPGKAVIARWVAANRKRLMILAAKRRAKARRLPFAITESDIHIPKRCPVLDIPLAFNGPRDFAPALDRIRNGEGYTPGNIQVISQRANRHKGDLSPAEMRKMARAFLRWCNAR